MSDSLFAQLLDAFSLLPDYRRVYDELNHTFYRTVNQAVAGVSINFSGIYSKLDYLLKEYRAPKSLSLRINDTRSRLHRRASLTSDEMMRYLHYDIRSIGNLISLIYHQQPPKDLACLYRNDDDLRAPTQKLLSEYLRVIVDGFDDDYITCHSYDYLDGRSLHVCYTTNAAYPGDWSYLCSMMKPGMQLNLIRPRIDADVLYPELIILDPDQLINVSTIASCFTEYAESRLVDLVKRIQPQESSEAIVLGNFAGQLLDEAIHQKPLSYDESVAKFFQSNAINLINVGISTDFHKNARDQRYNIGVAINTALPWTLSVFDSKQGIVEPSFFSEMLGLQGRMDFLQLDHRVLLEQKSGKGGYIPHDDYSRPRARTDHYVQLLLYMLIMRYNFRQEYDANSRQLHAFLLYSKYREPLVDMPFSTDLIFRALKVRNELAWANIHYTEPGGMRDLLYLTPESLNRKNINGRFWEQYVQPKLEYTLNPIHAASETERAYYFRFLTFIATEYMMSKVGTPDRDCSGFASTWLDSSADKRQSGNIYDGLQLVEPKFDSTERVEHVVLRFGKSADNGMSNFRPGDIVILYPYLPGQEPDARKSMVFRCTIESISVDTIILALRFAQSDARAFSHQQGKLWAIEHDFMESSYSSLFRGMHTFLSAPQERRDLLLMQRKPLVDATRQLKGEYGKFNTLMRHLKQASDMFLIIGPPGTGKTSFGMLNAVREELMDDGHSVLVITYTNRAVDEICSKLVDAGIDFIRMGSRHGCAQEYRPYLLSERVGNIKTLLEIRQLIINTRVFVGTTTAINANPQIFDLRSFSLAIVDEASQILEPHIIGILSATHGSAPAIGRFVLIGDHKQLPAVVQQPRARSLVDDPRLHAIGLRDCRLSLFERLLERYADDPTITLMLRHQGRMHTEIAEFSNRMFYGGKLLPVPLPHQLRQLEAGQGIFSRRVSFIAVDTPVESSSTKVNLDEAEVIARQVVDIYQHVGAQKFDVDFTVGVIVPYRNQIAAVRNAIDRYGIECLHDITIDTVERYQGSQREFIIYGFTIQRPFQLQFLTETRFVDSQGQIIDRKLNVALTRAREHLILVGNPELLSSDPIFSALIKWASN